MAKLILDAERLHKLSAKYIKMMSQDAPVLGEQAFLCCILIWYCALSAEKAGIAKAEDAVKLMMKDFVKSGAHKRLVVHTSH